MKLNIVFSADNNYVQHLTVAIFSLLKSSSSKDFYQIHIIDNNINQLNKNKIKLSLKQFNNFKLIYIAVNQKLFEKTQNFLHLNQSTYFKLIIPSLFPNLQKILYLDCDVIIFDDLKKLFNINTSNFCAAAVAVFHPNYQSVVQKTYNLEPLSFCFNAGVLMLNLNQMRIRQTTQKALIFLNDHLNSMIGADQVINNIILNNQCLSLDPKWNVQSYLFYAKNHHYCQLSKNKFESIKQNPAIIHFDGAKPWSFGNKHPYRDEYYKILDQTAFANWRPSFNFQQLFANSFFHYANALAKYLPEYLYHFIEQNYLNNNFLEKRYREIHKTFKKRSFMFRAIRYFVRLLISIGNLPYEIIPSLNTIDVSSITDTLKKLQQGYSIARFGDGEINIMLGQAIPFQDYQIELATQLKQILIDPQKKLLIGVPETFASLNEYIFPTQVFWRIFMAQNRQRLLKLVSSSTRYYSAYVTRPYLLFKDKSLTKLHFAGWLKILKNKKILIIEGEGTRFGVGNNLLDEAKSIQRVIAPAKNAYSRYRLILDETTKLIKKNHYDLVLIALGPTATILTAQLHKLGIQVIDIGHLDIEYEWFLQQTTKRIAIKGKSVLEADSYETKECIDEQYQNQIMAKLV